MNLFQRESALRALHRTMRTCRRCIEEGFDVTPRAIFSGKASARVMLVGQAPGKVETFGTGLPFSGPAGKRLMKWLGEAGWSEEEFRRDAYITAVMKCFPGSARSGRGDRAPSRKELAFCRPFLAMELFLVDPDVVIPVGRLAINYFLGSKFLLKEIVGKSFHVDGRTIVPLPHPSGASAWTNAPENQERIKKALAILRELKPNLAPEAPHIE